ncbi:hypothetical protein CLU79DRAFT_273502 [Phycomyces nitens]|nr:hypothetical protein CLU79DRAFT_273502 [Phycomyces nitens]
MNPSDNNNLFLSAGFDPSYYPPPYPQFQFSAGGPPRLQRPVDFQSQEEAAASFQLLAYQQAHQQRSDLEASTSPALSAQSAKRGQSKADRRAEHNAIERARRESLNTKFQQLAHTLPNLQNDSRPSKGTIIERTLDFVKHALAKEERYRYEIRELRIANKQLLGQLSHQTSKDRSSEKKDDNYPFVVSPTAAAAAAAAATGGGQTAMDTKPITPDTWDNSFYSQAFYDGSPLTTGSQMEEPSDDENSISGGDTEEGGFVANNQQNFLAMANALYPHKVPHATPRNYRHNSVSYQAYPP